jgi:hypothetical protein
MPVTSHSGGDIEAAAALAKEELSLANAGGDLRDRAIALQTAGFVEEIRCRFDAAADLHNTSIAIWREVGGPIDVGKVLAGLVGATCGRGDLAGAQARVAEAT